MRGEAVADEAVPRAEIGARARGCSTCSTLEDVPGVANSKPKVFMLDQGLRNLRKISQASGLSFMCTMSDPREHFLHKSWKYEQWAALPL